MLDPTVSEISWVRLYWRLMKDPGADSARHKAVLAAVLAVQRGHLSPDEAVRVLADLPDDKPVETLFSVDPGELAEADVAKLEATMLELGLSPDQQATLFSLRPGDGSEAATKALSSVAERRRKVNDITAKLPNAGATNRYIVKREFARGGMGLIWVALDTSVGREVALKELLPPKLGKDKESESPELIERFLREAKVTGQLEHPNIVPVYEIARRDDGTVFYSMKLVRGRTMAHRLAAIDGERDWDARRKLDERLKLLDAFIDVCNAVGYAHSRGVIHRDLKPANIMLGDFGETLVLDWGLARVLGQDESRPPEKAVSASLLRDETDSGTMAGAVLGTPAYMPPEQARGRLEQVDERADVYALGAILYELLSGRPPYVADSSKDVLAKVLVLEPEPLSELAPQAPPDLVSLAEKAMHRERDRRLASVLELAEEVRAFRDGRTLSVYRYSTGELLRKFVARHRQSVTVAAVALVLIVAGSVYAFLSVASERDRAQGALDDLARAEQQKREERERLVVAREAKISELRYEIDARNGPRLSVAANARIDELDVREGGLEPTKQAENAKLTQQLLELATMHERLVRLMTDPVAGQVHQFVPDKVLEEERDELRGYRLLAMELALRNEDFGFADFIVQDTDLSEGRRSELLQAIEGKRNEVLEDQRKEILSALEDVRTSLAKRAANRAITLNDYVLQLSAYRERQTVTLLGEALQPYVTAMALSEEPQFWTQPQRDEVRLILRVLAHLELPELAMPHLAEFARVVKDARLAIEAGLAQCATGDSLAWQPLVDVRARFGEDSHVWLQVRERLYKIPEPANLPVLETADELIARAEVRADFSKHDGAMQDYEAALGLEPENLHALSGKAHLLIVLKGGEAFDEVMALTQRVLDIDEHFARAWAAQAEVWRVRGDMPRAIECQTRAINAAPERWTHWYRRAFMYVTSGQYEAGLTDVSKAIDMFPKYAPLYSNRAAAYINLKRHDEALADLNRAIDLDPLQNEAWINRGVLKIDMEDYQGALDDLTRLLEIAPGHPWGHYNRGRARMEMQDYEGAIADFTRAVTVYPQLLTAGFVERAKAHIELGQKDEAIADLNKYLEYFNEGETADEARALLESLSE